MYKRSTVLKQNSDYERRDSWPGTMQSTKYVTSTATMKPDDENQRRRGRGMSVSGLPLLRFDVFKGGIVGRFRNREFSSPF